jgi:hypothetical protein
VLPCVLVLPEELCPAVPELPDGAVLPPDGELCAATHAPQHRTTESKVNFLMDLIVTSRAVVLPVIRSKCVLLLLFKRNSKLEYVRAPVEELSGLFRTSKKNSPRVLRGWSAALICGGDGLDFDGIANQSTCNSGTLSG